MTTRHWLAIAVGLTMTLLVEAAQAQSVDSSGVAAASDETRDVNVEADNMEVLEAQKKAIFTGNVSGERDGTRFSGDKMTISYDDRTRSDGSKKTEVTVVDVVGSVTIETATQTITGERAQLDLKDNILTVTGNVQVVQGKTVINGTKLTVNLKAKTSAMTGGRVKGSFVPGSSTP